jgi:hypothetical protein
MVADHEGRQYSGGVINPVHRGWLVCVGIGRVTALVVDWGEIPDRRMTAAPVVESLDELEHRDPRLGPAS